MDQNAPDARQRVVTELLKSAAAICPPDCPADLESFLGQYFRNIPLPDLKARDPGDLAGAALGHLAFGQKRKPGKVMARIFNPVKDEDGWESSHTIVEVVTDDMPFLVVSLGMVINRHDLYIHITVHPVLTVRRDDEGRLVEVLPPGATAEDATAESFMHLEIDREADPDIFRAIRDEVLGALGDVRLACGDWRAMRAKALEICAGLKTNPPPLSAEIVEEGRALLEWMEDDHFTFLGYREYELVKGEEFDTLKVIPETGLGILRKPSVGGDGTVVPRGIRRQARSRELLVITKANSRSTVHRPTYLDYVAVKHFDSAGLVIGEKRFLGLFTSVAYSRNPRSIPVLRHKVRQVMARSGFRPDSHGGKALQHILDTFPRDELFQASVEELAHIGEGIQSLQERQQVKLFLRRDAFRRFFSCLVFVPRDRYNTQVRENIQRILVDSLGGSSVESDVQMSESKLARAHLIVRTDPEKPPRPNIRSLELQIEEAIRTWHDHLRDDLIERFGEREGLRLFRGYGDAFPAAYMEDVTTREATFDIERLAAIEETPTALRMSLYRPPSFPDKHIRFKTFHAGQPLPISDILPMLENLGLRVISERPYQVRLANGLDVFVQDFDMLYKHDTLLPSQVNEIFQDAFENIWRGEAANDGFNVLVLRAGLDWRQITVLRAYCRYLLQTGMPFSQQYMEQVMSSNPHIARMMIEKFEVLFDPSLSDKARQRQDLSLIQALDHAMDDVASLDADRIISAFRAMIRSTLRTNFFQRLEDGTPKNFLSLKLDPTRIPDLPKPRPRFEVFVYSPRVEGVHLRGGAVARGGLRWSDRKEDFRTEVLGLMKAQAVKNTLIVPVGAKGGFVAKQLPEGDPIRILDEVKHCYRTFIRGLLDITDNLDDGALIPPGDTVRRDGDDPYLVVAADKGTATFSDIANGISQEYGFWLGDAFASGGSVGYDHKKMGITARGAWEAVKRHFRELGVDVQTTDFTAVGIGDMGGDVFGNGMLQSRHTRLHAAFNHVHIFLDPDPDAAQSFAERQRLFDLPRSTWMDYDPGLISQGGGVWSRGEKIIALSPQVRDMLQVEEEKLTPDDVIRAILKMPVDLLWNGGIGTYVKASTETNAEAGDRSNDAVRVDGRDLRCRVVGEGGNLGFTQRGRIEYALSDGRMNTDFIDNSGGVDCSDREVNIKILLNLAMGQAGLTHEERNHLLAEMTDEVAEQVLRNNYLQTQAISLLEANASERINEHAYLIRLLERRGILDRELEFLPSDEDIDLRSSGARGLTRPELAVLLSYGKMALYSDMIVSNVPEDAYLSKELVSYFPRPLQQSSSGLMTEHRLSREIIATLVTNSLVNRMGPVFAYRTQDETGADLASVARAYAIAREVFDIRSLWAAIESLDNRVHANAQYSMMNRTSRLLKHGTHWFLDRAGFVDDIAESVSRFAPATGELMKCVPEYLSGDDRIKFTEAESLYRDIGIPAEIAVRMAGLQAMHSALDIVEVAQVAEAAPGKVARIYFLLGQRLGLNWLREQVENLAVTGRWQAMARNSMRENLYFLQGQLTRQVMEAAGKRRGPESALDTWGEARQERLSHVNGIIGELRAVGTMDFPTLSVAIQEVRRLSQI
jgi:glutamate dehydrogenase